jgi:hypothetical protein
MVANPRSLRARIDPPKPDASAHAPWTNTIVGLSAVIIVTRLGRGLTGVRRIRRPRQIRVKRSLYVSPSELAQVAVSQHQAFGDGESVTSPAAAERVANLVLAALRAGPTPARSADENSDLNRSALEHDRA